MGVLARIPVDIDVEAAYLAAVFAAVVASGALVQAPSSSVTRTSEYGVMGGKGSVDGSSVRRDAVLDGVYGC